MKKLWPVWIAIGMPVLLIALNSTPISLDFAFVVLGIPALLGIWACLGIWALVITVRRSRRLEWSRAAASAVLPLVILGAGVRFSAFVQFCNDGGDVVHFIAARSSYLKEIRVTQPDGEPLLLVFNRGGMIWASRGYVYDESDEVTREEPLRSARWRALADKTELSCGYYAEPFPGHFSFTRHWYLASFNC
jgi:hypothetical protein